MRRGALRRLRFCQVPCLTLVGLLGRCCYLLLDLRLLLADGLRDRVVGLLDAPTAYLFTTILLLLIRVRIESSHELLGLGCFSVLALLRLLILHLLLQDLKIRLSDTHELMRLLYKGLHQVVVTSQLRLSLGIFC